MNGDDYDIDRKPMPRWKAFTILIMVATVFIALCILVGRCQVQAADPAPITVEEPL